MVGSQPRRAAPMPYGRLMADGEVFVIDRVVTRPGCARQFVDTYLAEYAPGARERGMTLRDVMVSPPIWFDGSDEQVNTITITWTLPSAQAWWQMTWKGRPDAALGQWWSQAGDLVAERSRSFAAAADDVDGLCDV
jgi:hypothetical protein